MARFVKTTQSSEIYTGDIILRQLADLTWEWRVDNKIIIMADYEDPVEIDNPYYADGLSSALEDEAVTIEPYIPPDDKIPDHYRIWNYVHSTSRKHPSITPIDVNYKGVDMTIRPHRRVWLKETHGLVSQMVFYAGFDPETKQPHTPLVRERWTWALNPESNMAEHLCKKIEYFRDQPDPDTGEEVLLPYKKHMDKYYDTASSQIEEIKRRRHNVVTFLEEDVIGMITVTQTAANPAAPTDAEIKEAINLGTLFLNDVSKEVLDFKEQGSEQLAVVTMEQSTQDSHPWLQNDLLMLGSPGVTIAMYIANEITTDTSEAMSVFSHDSLPPY